MEILQDKSEVTHLNFLNGNSISEAICLLCLAFNFILFMNIPPLQEMGGGIFYLYIFFFLLFVLNAFTFDNFLSFKLPKVTFLRFLFFLLFLFFFISVFIVNSSGSLSFKPLLKILAYPIVIFFYFVFLSRKFFDVSDFFYKFLKGFLIFAIFNSIFGIFSMYTGFGYKDGFAGQCLGFFSHPNSNAFIYTISFPILLFFYFEKKISLSIFLFVSFLFLYCLLFTFSRTGYASMVCAILVFTFLKSKKLFLISLFVLFVISFFFLIDAATSKSDSSIVRMMLIVTAIQMIVTSKSSFLWGYGVYDSIEIFKVEKIFFGNYELVVDPHNWILLLGIQFGMLIPIIMLIIFIVVIYRGIRERLKLKDMKLNLIITSISICIGLFVQDITEDIIVYPEIFAMPIFLIFFGYIYHFLNSHKNKIL